MSDMTIEKYCIENEKLMLEYERQVRNWLADNGEIELSEKIPYFRDGVVCPEKWYEERAIFNYFDKESNSAFRQTNDTPMSLRYGENPHQKGAFYGNFNDMLEQIHGKEISYNNLLDINAAVELINDFAGETTFAILKHNNACGLASRPTLAEAWDAALAGDPVSAFGGVLIANANVDKATAEKVNEIFFEVIIAPSYDADALEVLKQKKNRSNESSLDYICL